MTDYTNEEHAVLARAGQARSELLQTEEAFGNLRSAFIQAWVDTDAADAAERERLYLAVKVLDNVRSALAMLAAGAAVAEYGAVVRAVTQGRSIV